MKISADVASIISAERLIIAEHGDRRITFPLSLYKKTNFSQDNETFLPINDYWATLSEADQDDIYAIYEDVRELFDSSVGNKELTEELTKITKRLMDHHKTAKVKHWVQHKSNLVVPTKDIADTFKYDVDKNTTEDRTYTRPDYYGLMALSVLFRAMIPIWAMYNKPAKDSIGKVKKSLHAFLLLRTSEVYTSEPIQKLLRYVEANIKKDTHTGNHTLEFISSGDMPVYLLSIVCVQKLCLGDMYENPRQNLAALTYTYIIDRPGPAGGEHSQQVKTKKVQTEGAGETSEHSGSTLELYKARSNMTMGRIAELEYALRDPVNLAIQLCPTADEQQVALDCERALFTARAMLEKGIQIPQVILAQWVIAPVFPPQGLQYVQEDAHTREELLHRVCALTETVLRHRGFGYLALLSTAVPIVDSTSMAISPIGSRAQLGEDLVAALSLNYPFKREPKKKTPTNNSLDFVQEDIKNLSSDFSQFTWRATADESLVKAVLKTHVRRIQILPQLRSDIGWMLVKAEEEFN